MVRINNIDLKRAFSDSTKTQLSEQATEVGNIISPVIDISTIPTKLSTFSKYSTGTSTSGVTIFTSNATKRTLITGITLSYCGNATDDCTHATIAFSINGGTNRSCYLSHVTGDTTSKEISQSFPFPIEIDKNSAVSLTIVGATAGARVYAATVSGIEIDTQ